MTVLRDIREDRFCRMSFLLTVLYIIVLLPFYLTDHYVPDTRLYSSFAAQGLPAKDGFPSLFIAIAGLINIWPKGLHVMCLCGLAGAMFFLTYFYRKIFSVGNRAADLLTLLLICSSGNWYYLYGKLFYDFPLTAATLAVVLYLIVRIWFCDGMKGRTRIWAAMCGSLGVLLSWKPYNIFILAGLALLMLCKEKGRALYREQLGTGRGAVRSVILFAAGFTFSNFYLFLKPGCR